MPINEVFPNPTVKKVIFQIRYPNLFFIENKIGDIQLKIMSKFPESALIVRRQLIVADIGPGMQISNKLDDTEDSISKKIWQFKSSIGMELNILSDALDINSGIHKTYNLEGGEKFRNIIEFVVDNFISITGIPIINRIGLRYIDECPMPNKNNESFREFYNTTFPLNRFNIADAKEMKYSTIILKGTNKLRYQEVLIPDGDNYKLFLDFDGFTENINSADYLATTDALHAIIREEYENTIKEPVYRIMRARG